jgi:predicted nucleic acid-binding protein|tara:strand:+ start:99 stop:398 length:300 start_codon:yes stop_codon:yes gene_type:complete
MKSVKVGPTDFSIEYVPLNDELFGDFSYINSRIRIEENLKGSALVDTVLHEILHAIWKLGQLKDKREDEERAVAIMATYLTQVLRDNPKMLTWLKKNLV